jgi:hypothetical protein
MRVCIYHETFEVDERLLYPDVVPVHKLGQLRNVVTYKLKYILNFANYHGIK